MRVEIDRFVNPFDKHSARSLDVSDSECIERYVKLERRKRHHVGTIFLFTVHQGLLQGEFRQRGRDLLLH